MSKIAIFSPAKDAYSETFIQAHRKLNGGGVIFVHGPINDLKIDGESIIKYKKRVLYILLSKVFLKNSNLGAKMAIRKVLKRRDVKSILIEYGTYACDLWPYMDKYKDKILVHFHGYDASKYNILQDNRNCYCEIAESTRGVVVVSEAMKKELIGIGVNEGNIVLNHYGANPIFLDDKSDSTSCSLFAVGRFVPKKSPYYLVIMMNELVKKYPDLKLKIAGEGPLLEVCQNLTRFYNLENNIEFLGVLNTEEVAKEMKKATCFVQHSVRAKNGDMEGTPLAILEACLSGKPVVSTRHSGIKDVIIHGETGLLVDEHDVVSMINYVDKLLNDQNYRDRLGDAAKRRVLKEFSQERHLNKLDQLLE